MAWPLARKVSGALLAILVGTVAVTGFFTYSRLQSVLSSLVQSRYGVQVYAIKRNVEDRLALGFPLKQLRPVQDTIDREKVDDRRIRGIEVFDAHGTILFDTERGDVGASVPPSWVESSLDAGNQLFADEDEDGNIVGVPLINSLGAVEGGVVLRYPGAYLQQTLGPMLGGLARQAGVVLAVFAVVAAAGAQILFRQVRRRLETMAESLVKVVADGGEPVAADEGDRFGTDFAAFARKMHETAEDLKETSADVERLDRLA
jgi:hypothetical protein